jgi:hypothetical protein
VCTISENNVTKLRISRAYFNLMCLPEDGQRTVSLAWIGSCEIRMQDAPRSDGAGEPLFIMDLFDHDAQLSIDSRLCYGIADGAAVFEAFVSR